MNTYPDIDDCSEGPCIHGACQDQVHGYICHCDLFHVGETCHLSIPLLQFISLKFKVSQNSVFATTTTIIIPSFSPNHELQAAKFPVFVMAPVLTFSWQVK